MLSAFLAALLGAAAVPAWPAAARSADGRLEWVPGDAFVSVKKRPGFAARGQKVPLPALEKGAKRRVVFPAHGDFFAVLDEADAAVGLHRDAPRGARAALAVVTGSTLRLVNARGRVLWAKRLPETHAVGGDGAGEPLALGADGTSALLLQDIDPYTKARPLVLVLGPKGGEVQRLDYTAWSRVDEMLLSDDGRWLVVRGIGRIPADDTWGSALGHYGLRDAAAEVYPTPAASGAKSLRAIDSEGRACCLLEGKTLSSIDHDGQRRTVEPRELEDRFGVKP